MRLVPSALALWIAGTALFGVALAAAFLANGEIWLLGAVALYLAVLGLDAGFAFQSLSALTISVPALIRLFTERPAEFPVRVDWSARPRSRIRVGFAFPEGLTVMPEDRWLDLESASSQVSWPIVGERRGRYWLDAVAAECPSPLRLWDVRRRFDLECEVRVYPRIRQARDLALLRREGAGIRSVRQVGQGREFEKLREYVAGDGFDEIHWKATARRAAPVTKVFQVERTQEVYVLIDAGRMSAREVDGELILDRYLESALLMALAAEGRGDLFGIATFSDRVHGFVRARNGKAHYGACREMIYQLESSPVSADFESLAAFLYPLLSRRALLIVLSSFDDPVAAESFARAQGVLSRKHLLIAGALRPRSVEPLFGREPLESAEQIYDRLAGHVAWHQLKQQEITWRRQGARLLLFEPGTLNAQLLAAYDEVKQRQLL